jgi:hypothetical protein
MPPIAILLLACSSGVHAAWNIRLKGARDPEAAATTAVILPGLIAGAAALLAIAFGVLHLDAVGAALGLAAGLAELAYFMTLARAYAGAPISVVYPIVRGINPLLAVLFGTLLLGEHLAGLQPVGIACIIVGLLVIRPPWKALRGGIDRTSLGFALAAGCLSATGSTIERVGVQHLGAAGFLCVTWGVTGALYLLVARRNKIARVPTPSLALTGVLIIGGHFLVMAAFAVAPLSLVIPLRESAILLVSGWGLLRAQEATNSGEVLTRVGGAVAIVAGALLIALG